jgi:AcrR family transcriptional regulator
MGAMGHDVTVTELVAALAPDAPTPARGRPRSTSADRAILQATIEILIHDGYDGLTMAGVAQRAGVSTATLYRRYESKVDLVVGCIAAVKDEYDQPYDTGTLEGDLHALARDGCAAFSTDGGGLMGALIGEVQRNPDLADAVRERVIAHRTDKVRRMIDAAVERGEIASPVDAGLAMEMIVGPFIFRRLVTGEPLDDEFAANLVELALRLLGAAPTEPDHGPGQPVGERAQRVDDREGTDAARR